MGQLQIPQEEEDEKEEEAAVAVAPQRRVPLEQQLGRQLWAGRGDGDGEAPLNIAS